MHMAVRVIKALVCDMCGGDSEVRRWRVAEVDGRKISPDLCEACGKPLEEMMKRLPAGKRGQSRPRPVVTETQIRAARRKKNKK